MLDLFFKKYAWTANLVLIFAAAWITARMVNTVVGAVVRPRPTVDVTSLPAAPPPTPKAELALDNVYALFGQKLPPPPAPEDDTPAPAAPAAPQNCHDRSSAPVRSQLRAALVAGVVADNPRSSMASITDLNTRETRVYGVGDSILGASLISVEKLRDPRDATGAGFTVAAIVCNNGQKEYIDFDESGGAGGPSPMPPPAYVPPPSSGPQQASAVDGVRKVNDNRYEVKKKYIDDTLANLNAVATQARIVPSFKNGVANGFKLFSIQPNSLYSAIGVENGDVIQRINGYEINSPDKALEVYQKLRESSHITIDIERNGQIVRKEYNVTGS
jgi:general secretion pathway protein C